MAGQLDTAYALPLYSVVDPAKVDPRNGLPESMADQLQAYFQVSLHIKALSFQFVMVSEDPYLLIGGLEKASLPALLALADVQKTTLYRFERPDPDTVTLTPLAVQID
jgi:hypothetical protein